MSLITNILAGCVFFKEKKKPKIATDFNCLDVSCDLELLKVSTAPGIS